MHSLNWSFQLTTLPLIFTRGHHVQILLRDPQGQFVLGEKRLYPPGIVRMVGGGVESDETALKAAQRELEEETELRMPSERLHSLAEVYAEFSPTPDAREPFAPTQFHSSLFFLPLKPGERLIHGDDLDGLAHLSRAEFEQLIDRYAHLDDQFEEELNFAWSDYGPFFGKLHRLALDLAEKLD